MGEFWDKVEAYYHATGDPLAANLVAVKHNVENYDHDNPSAFVAVDTASGVGTNPTAVAAE